MASTNKVRRITTVAEGDKDIEEVAEIISQAFSDDLLIRWLMDEGSPDWDRLDPALQRWQVFRTEKTVLTGTVLGAFYPDSDTPEREKCGGVALIFPSSGDGVLQNWMKTARYGLVRWLWKQVSVGPLPPFVDHKRWEQMMVKHNAGLQQHMQGYPDYRYLEVIATSPVTRGSGIGKALMLAVIEEAHGLPIVLECTDEKNIPFYEKFGFSSVGKVELEDGTGSTAMWIMVRKPQ